VDGFGPAFLSCDFTDIIVKNFASSISPICNPGRGRLDYDFDKDRVYRRRSHDCARDIHPGDDGEPSSGHRNRSQFDARPE